MPTLLDIAKKTGLSLSVVSRALNPTPDKSAWIAEATRLRVERAARKLGYFPNRPAALLRRGIWPAIGAFLPYMRNRLAIDQVAGMAEAAEEAGLPISFYFGLHVADVAANFKRFLQKRHYCGVITYPYGHEPALSRLVEPYRQRGGQIVFFDADLPSQRMNGAPVAGMDEEEGGRLAARRLLDRGCRTFLLYGDHFPLRTAGFQEVLAAEGFAFETCADSPAGLARAAQRTRARRLPSPIGIFATRDALAMRFLRTLPVSCLGRVGTDVLLIGYDDLALAEEAVVPLTTIAQPRRELGRESVRMLVDLIDGRPTDSVRLTPSLVVRKSA